MDAQTRAETERWFVHRGYPHAIADYSATDDVFTRAAPFLGFVLFVEIFASFDDRFDGWAQVAAFCAGVAIIVAAFVGVNRLRGRKNFELPDHIGVLELAVFVLVPALLPVLFSNERSLRFFTLILVNLAILIVAYTVTSYGLVPALRVGLAQMIRQFSQVVGLMARGLPLLLVFSVFVFLNAEMWQVAQDFDDWFYAIVVSTLVLLAIGFVLLRLPKEIDSLHRFQSWEQVCSIAQKTDAPLASDQISMSGAYTDTEPVQGVKRLNLGLLLVVSQVVQVLLIGMIIGLFYLGFGLLAVRRTTIQQWTTDDVHEVLAPWDVFGAEVVLTWELLAVAGFIAAFSMLQFAVSSTTDSAMREEFTQQAIDDVREVLAVQAIYNQRISSPKSS